MPIQLTPRRLACLALAAKGLVLARLRVALCDQTALADVLTKERGDGAEAAALPETWLQDLAWAITGLARRLPFRADCLVRVLAAEAILRDRAPFEIHVGAGHIDDRFGAHTWLTCQGIDLTGGAVVGLEPLERSLAGR